MKNLTTIIVLAALIIFGLVGCSKYNSFVSLDEDVNQSWSNVESAYQRRADLIPNLVATVKNYADFEQETLTAVVNARAKATSVNIDASNLTPETMQQFQQAQGELSGALSRLLVTVEKYPDLKANQNFLELQSQLEGTENRIKVERDKFNGVVAGYNKSVRSFPGNIFAGVFGFDRRADFDAEPGSDKNPNVGELFNK